MRAVEMLASNRVNAERKRHDHEKSGEGVEGCMTRVPGRPAEEASEEDGDGREEDESE